MLLAEPECDGRDMDYSNIEQSLPWFYYVCIVRCEDQENIKMEEIERNTDEQQG